MSLKKPENPLRPLIFWASVVYLIVLCGVLYALEHCGERQWFLGALLYLPAEGWLLPLMILVPLALLVRPSVCLLHVAAVVAVYFGYQGLSAGIVAEASGDTPTLTVVTANIGQRRMRALEEFLYEKDADIIVFQEAKYPERRAQWQLPDFYYGDESEFTIASRYPITQSGVVPGLNFRGHPVAAWFELDYGGQPIVVYSVHMPTPRPFLRQMASGGFMSAVLSCGGFLNDDFRHDCRDYWKTRFELGRGLLAALKNERRPLIVAGDFNTPDHGALYKLFAADFTDSFAAAGSGSGKTFPANAHGYASQIGPWMRLDYLFAGREWRPLACEVEPFAAAQHLSVMAKYELIGGEEKPAVAQADEAGQLGETW